MSARDRMVSLVIGALVIVGACWMLLVSPERKKAGELASQVSAAQSQLAAAEGQLQSARSAQHEYASAYQAVVSLGKAVPAAQEVPSLIYQLEQASNSKHVEFASITTGSGTQTGGQAPAAAAAASTFSAMPFTFIFNGGFFDLEHLFNQLTGFATRTSTGLQVSGRLLTIQSLKLGPASSAGAPGSGASAQQLSGTITASAYVLPSGQGLTAGAGPAAPAAPGAAAATASPTTPAIARVP